MNEVERIQKILDVNFEREWGVGSVERRLDIGELDLCGMYGIVNPDRPIGHTDAVAADLAEILNKIHPNGHYSWNPDEKLTPRWGRMVDRVIGDDDTAPLLYVQFDNGTVRIEMEDAFVGEHKAVDFLGAYARHLTKE